MHWQWVRGIEHQLQALLEGHGCRTGLRNWTIHRVGRRGGRET
jgi:hypothetical protein